MRAFLSKLLIYALLIAGSCVFIIPLVWMFSTALKPIEQTMALPPTWVPYRMFVERDGERIEVRRGERFKEPLYVVLPEGTDVRMVVPRHSVSGGRLIDSAGEAAGPVEILQEVNAGPDSPWLRVTPVEGTGDDWFILPDAEVIRKPAPRWGNFKRAIVAMKYFPQYLKNTLILCVLTVFGTVLSSALAAYGFSRVDWRGRNKVFLVALATMMIPFPVVMVPIYTMFKALGWIGSLKPLWVGTFFAGAFNVFLLRQFFMSIPKDLSDAARIDGCSELRIFWQIMLPLCRPALMVVGLFQFMFTWNDFLGPLIYLTDQKDFTLALGLQFFQSQHGGTEWHYLMAASTLIVLPVIVLFFFTQKSFIEGISMTGLKG